MAGATGDVRALLRQLVVAGGEFLGSVFRAKAMYYCISFARSESEPRTVELYLWHDPGLTEGKGAVLAASFQLLQYEKFPENPIYRRTGRDNYRSKHVPLLSKSHFSTARFK